MHRFVAGRMDEQVFVFGKYNGSPYGSCLSLEDRSGFGGGFTDYDRSTFFNDARLF